MWKMMKVVVIQDLTEPTKMLKKHGPWVHSNRCVSIRAMALQLNLDKETVTCIEKGLNFGPTIVFSTNNIPAHKAHSVKQFLAQKSINKMEHPPYSPDLVLNDFWLFPKIKSALMGPRFQDTEDIQKMRQHCWSKCRAALREYFKVDPSQQAVTRLVYLQ